MQVPAHLLRPAILEDFELLAEINYMLGHFEHASCLLRQVSLNRALNRGTLLGDYMLGHFEHASCLLRQVSLNRALTEALC